jgi:hypothetical protein
LHPSALTGRLQPRKSSVPDRAKKLTPARTFLALALGFGLLIAVVNPPFAVNDEEVHIARIYELSEGRWLTRSDERGEYHIVPSDYVELGNEYERVWQKAGGRVQLPRLWQQLTQGRAKERVRRFGRAGSYPPLLYAPQVPVLFVARLFDTSVLVQLYLARFAAILAYAWLAYRAVVTCSQLQWPLIIAALLPMALTQAASVSGDGLVIGLSLLCFALVGKGIFQGRLTRADSLGLMLTLAALTLCKPLYILVALAFPALPWKDASGAPLARAALLRWLYPLASVLVSTGLYLGWRQLIKDLHSIPNDYDSAKQLAWLRENYGQIPGILAHTWLRHGDELLIESVLVRNKISNAMRFAPAIAFVLHAQLALATAWGSAVRPFPGSTRARHFAAACFAAAWLAIVLALPAAFYVCCTKIGASSVRVLQGRYFIPALPALLIALSFVGRPVLSRWLSARGGFRIFFVLCALNVLCLFCLVGWHYFSRGARWPF